MTDSVQPFAEAAAAIPLSAPVWPLKPLRWVRRNLPRHLRLLRSRLDLRVTSLALQPTLKELLVAASVMIFTAALSFLGIMAAAG